MLLEEGRIQGILWINKEVVKIQRKGSGVVKIQRKSRRVVLDLKKEEDVVGGKVDK
jgi:hypothetical protein